MAQLRFIEESPSRRTLFKDMWELSGRRPSPVEVDQKYKQLSANKSYGIANRLAAAAQQRGVHASNAVQRRSDTALPAVRTREREEEATNAMNRARSEVRQAQAQAAAEVDKHHRETTAAAPTDVDNFTVFTLLSDDSEDEEANDREVAALRYWQKRHEDQLLVRKAFARSKSHKQQAVKALLDNLPHGTTTGPYLPGQYQPFRLNRFSSQANSSVSKVSGDVT